MLNQFDSLKTDDPHSYEEYLLLCHLSHLTWNKSNDFAGFKKFLNIYCDLLAWLEYVSQPTFIQKWKPLQTNCYYLANGHNFYWVDSINAIYWWKLKNKKRLKNRGWVFHCLSMSRRFYGCAKFAFWSRGLGQKGSIS